MALKDALAPIKASNCIDITFEKAVVKALTQVYADMAAGPTITIEAGTSATVPDGGGTVNVEVIESPAGTFTVNLTDGE